MSKRVLFTSQRPYGRAENISAAFDAYDGEKDFVQLNMNCYDPAILSGKYDLMVTDEYPAASPGKVILLWHAIEGGKLIGLRQPHPYAGINHMARITYVATSGTGAVPIIINNTGLPEKRIIPTGMPILIRRKATDALPLQARNTHTCMRRRSEPVTKRQC